MKIDTKKLRTHLEGALACLDAHESGDEDKEMSAAPEEDGDDGDMGAKMMKMKMAKYK